MSVYHTIDVEAELTPRLLEVEADVITEINHNTVSDYNLLTNKPQINSVTLVGNKSLPEIGVDVISNMELEEMLQ